MAIRSHGRWRPAILSRLARLLRAAASRARPKPSGSRWQPVLPFEPRAGEGFAAASVAPASRLEQLALGAELTRTLDRHELSRSVMPALALLERALATTSGRGEARLAAPVLWDAINHINMLADSWQGSGLATLRRRLVAALGLEEEDVAVLCPPAHSLQVADARMSDFMQVMDQWTRASNSSTGDLAGPAAPGSSDA